jgi:Na+-translocating ferredoxin:NAD+ oxidoreductase RnfG subunit
MGPPRRGDRSGPPFSRRPPSGSVGFLWPIVVAILLIAGPSHADRVYLTVDQALANAFPQDVTVERKVVWITAAQAAQVEARAGSPLPRRVVNAYLGRRGGRIVGYAFVDDVIGKTEPITYMVTVTPDATVERLDLLVFRETHGYEIERASWRDRFRGLRLGAGLRVGREIDKITGATLSCRAVTDGVRRLLALTEVVLAPPAP